MPLILHIDTATDNATVSIAQNDHLIGFVTNANKKDHASFLQPAIKNIFNQNNIPMHQLRAVCVTHGPGSYTGLRVGMASAKGICYALQVPLITLSTLEVMALSVIKTTANPASYLYCPMIDAGRMEVFTALYDYELNSIMPACAIVLEPRLLEDQLTKKSITFFGSGAEKFIKFSERPLLYSDTVDSAPALTMLALKFFEEGLFADLVNSEPTYLKQFHMTLKTREV